MKLNEAKKYCENVIGKDAYSQLIFNKKMNQKAPISNQRPCTWVSQGGYRRCRRVLYLCDGLLDYPSRHSLSGQTPLRSASHSCCKALWTFRTYQWCLSWWAYNNNNSIITSIPVQWVKSMCCLSLSVSTITMKLVWNWKQFDFISLPWQYSMNTFELDRSLEPV